MSGGQYQGSQAFAHISPSQAESVNPNTGSLDYTAPLIKLQGVRSSIDLTLDLFYSAGSPGTFGLPKNWGLNLPYVLNHKSLTVDRRTYAIDYDWTTSTGHESRLRYMNHGGIQFSKLWPPVDLPSGLPGMCAYQLQRADGSSDYFDEHGKPLEHRDMHGNFIYYSYDEGGADRGPDYNDLRLEYILDSWGQKIEFLYLPSVEMCIKLPNGDKTTVSFSEGGLVSIEDQENLRTSFEYASFGATGTQTLLSRINYPTGLTSTYEYGPIEYIAKDGSGRAMPAVQFHFYHGLDDNFHGKVEYRYGETSLQTYTGAAIGLKMFGTSDSLMDGDGAALEYKYDVSKYVFEENDKESAKIVTWYNNYHLPVEEIKYNCVGGQFVEVYKTVYTYTIDVDKRARTASYTQPTSIESFHNISNTDGETQYQPLTLTKSEYDEFANQVSVSEELYVLGRGYVKQTTTTNDYFTTPAKTQIVTKSVTVDEVAQVEHWSENTATADGKQVASTTYSFRAGIGSGIPLQKGRQRSYEYDAQGRKTSEKLAWSPDASVPAGSVASATERWGYDFNDGILTVTEVDAGGAQLVIKYDVRMYSAPMISKKLPLGQLVTFEYDRLGRQVKQTDALGYQTVTKYTTGDAGSTQQVTSPSGYVKLTRSDILGREIETFDNGDPTKPVSAEPSRLLQSVSYDWLSRVKQSTDRFGLKTSHTYDGLGRSLTTTDPNGNIFGHVYDDVALSVTQTVNGDVRSVTQLDGRSKPIRVVNYPDSADTQTQYCLVEETQYNGGGKVIATIHSQKPKDTTAPVTITQRNLTQYGLESAVVARVTTGFTEHGQDSIKRSFELDLFGNTHTWVKETSYADGRTFTHQGPVQIHDANNRAVLGRNQMGQEERSFYDENGWLIRTVRYDGSEIRYTCDDVGQTIKAEYSSSTTETVYNNEGRAVEIHKGADVMAYETAIDGTLTKITYGDGRTQSITLDRYSRPVKETDVFGVTRETEFNQNAQVAGRSCNGDKVTYIYGPVNHMNGQSMGYSLTGALNYQKIISCDGFGRVVQTAVTDPNAGTYLDTKYALDSTGKVRLVESSSRTSAQSNQARAFVYDGIGQLTSDTSKAQEKLSTTTYLYDGNSNIVTKDVDGQASAMTYNQIDQRTDAGFEYDQNGRLVRDNLGRSYSFDDQDHLVSVQMPGNASDFSYQADGYLAECRGNGEQTRLYHGSGKINALDVTGTGERVSLFSGSESVIATYSSEKAGKYFMDQLGSTALTVQGDTHAATSYDAYGVATSSAADTQSSFRFGQEFSDVSSGLVYLRYRYYSPEQMAFISMDSNHQENRYAYCEGDPVNRHDPLGLSWQYWVGAAVGAVVGGAVTAGVGSAIGAAFGAGLAASLSAAVIGGAAGTVAGEYATSIVTGEEYGWDQAWRSAAVGGIVSGVSFGALKGAERFSGRIGARFAEKSTHQWRIKKAMDGAASAVGGGMAKAVAQPLLRGEDISLTKLGIAFVQGVVMGAAVGFVSGAWSGGAPGSKDQLFSPSFKYTARGRAWFNRTFPGSHRPRLNAMVPGGFEKMGAPLEGVVRARSNAMLPITLLDH